MTHRILIIAALALGVIGAQAQTLTNGQRTTLCTACKGSAACNTPRLIGDSVSVLQWLNGARAPSTLAWHVAAPHANIESAPSYTSYDTLAQGKRDSWLVLLRNQRDFTKNVIRNWVVDVWGGATAGSNSEKVLLAATFEASNAQHALGGTSRSTGTVSALDLAWPYSTSQDDANYVADPARCQG